MSTTHNTQTSASAQVLPAVTMAAAAQIKRAFSERNDELQPRGATLSAVTVAGLLKVQINAYPCALVEAQVAADVICADVMGRSSAFSLPFEHVRTDSFGRDIYRASLPLAY